MKIVTLFLLFAGFCGSQVCIAAEILLLDSKKKVAELLELDSKALLLRSGQDEARCEIEEVDQLGSPTSFKKTPLLFLADGSVIAVSKVEVNSGRLTAWGVWGETALPTSRVAGFLLHEPDTTAALDQALRNIQEGLPPQRRKLSDVAMLNTGDQVEGVLSKLDAKSLTILSHGVKISQPLSSVRLLSLRQTRRPLVKQSQAPKVGYVGLTDGSYFPVAKIEWSDGVATFETPSGFRLSALPSQIAVIQQTQSVTYLSDVLPWSGNKHRPAISLPRKYRRDLNVNGGKLRVGRQLYQKGLGVAPLTSLVYGLRGEYKEFRTQIALDTTAGKRGGAIFVVTVDGEEKFRSDVIRGGDAPRDVVVDITGGNKLTLTVTFADGGESGDIANWLNARVF